MFGGLDPRGGNAGMLVTLDFEEHRAPRRILQPAFTTSAIEGYLGTADRIVLETIGRWTDCGRKPRGRRCQSPGAHLHQRPVRRVRHHVRRADEHGVFRRQASRVARTTARGSARGRRWPSRRRDDALDETARVGLEGDTASRPGRSLRRPRSALRRHRMLRACRFRLDPDYDGRHTFAPFGTISGKVRLALEPL